MKRLFAIILVLVLFFSASLIFVSVSHQKRSAMAQTCQDDDGVCPTGCTPENDSDCQYYQELGKTKLFGGEEGKYPYSPWVMHEPGWGSYLMYFCENYDGRDRIFRIESWTDGKNDWDWNYRLKVIEGGVNPEDEDYLSCSPGVVIDSQGTWHMYYVTASGEPGTDMVLYLHHAIAQAPGTSWTKLGRIQVQGVDQPFFPPDYIETPSPLFIDNQIVLYYVFDTINESGKLKGKLMRTTSTDGHHFSVPVEVNIADDPVQAGHVKYIDGVYYYVYSRNPADPYQYSTHIYISTSTDGINFSEGIPLFHAEGSDWDSWRAWSPDLLIENSILRIYYAGAKNGDAYYNIGLRWFSPQTSSPILQCESRQKTYQGHQAENAGGPSLLHFRGWDRYIMFFGATCSVQNGKVRTWRNNPPGDPGTCRPPAVCNNGCATDKILQTWHMGDGKEMEGWDEGGVDRLPRLVVDIGGNREQAMVADPAVVEWRGKYHLYYEATDNCQGNDNRIFHAESNDLFGTFVKTGMVNGLAGSTSGSGLSWPSVFVENDQLYLYYTDGYVRLYAASATDDSGQNFQMENSGQTVLPSEYVNEGVVRKQGDRYLLFYDIFGGHGIKVTASKNKFNFPRGEFIIRSDPEGSSNRVTYGLSDYLPKDFNDGSENRLYYSAFGKGGDGLTTSWIEVCTFKNVNYLGDFNKDERTDDKDFKILLQNWGDSPLLDEADLNYDNIVNGLDFGIILGLL